MNAPLKIDMKAVTDLTRQGRLKEAMALLGGSLFGGRPAEPATGPVAEPVIDMTPPKAEGEAWTAAEDVAAPPPEPQPASPVHTLLDRMKDFTPQGFDHLPGMENLRPKVAPAVPEGGSFEDYSFNNAYGTRPYKLYVPSGYAGHSQQGRAVPLVVMLHGCTQSPDDFAAGTRMNELAEEEVFLVVYPGQTKTANAQKCWNWFNPADQARDAGEPSLIAGITRQVMDAYNVDPERVFIAGLSAGGAAAAIMGSSYPDLYAGVGVHSGLACGVARDMPSAFTAMRQGGQLATAVHKGRKIVPTIVFHADDDKTVNPVNADQVIVQARGATKLRAETERGVSRGGVGYTRTVMADADGKPVLEQWTLHGAGHAWSGGSSARSYTAPNGPDASREMLRFFLQQKQGG